MICLFVLYDVFACAVWCVCLCCVMCLSVLYDMFVCAVGCVYAV